MYDIKSKIREVSDWPKPGIGFKDITPLLEDAEGFKEVINQLTAPYLDQKINKVVGIDARGFIFAAAMAYKLGAGLAIVRKKGKLPWKTIGADYALEYAANSIEMHEDSVLPGERILIVDDVLATGGTMETTVGLVKKLGGEIAGISFVIELGFLDGRKKLEGNKIHVHQVDGML